MILYTIILYSCKVLNDLSRNAFIKGNKGEYRYDSPQVKGILYALKFDHKLPDPMVMYHHGRCACCGKKLTDEESVRLGIGPTCRRYYLRGI